MTADLFTDTFYHGENSIEFEPHDVVKIEERSERLWLRGRHEVTQITLRSGAQWVLRGALKSQIEAAQRENAAA